MNIRSNASIKSVAEEATKQAMKLRREWLRCHEVVQQCGTGLEANVARHHAQDAFNHFCDVKELANHLRRLAGLSEIAELSR